MNWKSISFDEAQVWLVPLNVATKEVRNCESVLSRDEVARADRFVTAELRRRFIVCRGTLRKLLAANLDLAPEEIRFRYELWGKPQLALPATIHFNVSHSADWAIIGLAHSPLGVDLELSNDRIHYHSIASQVLSVSERSAWELLNSSAREEAILQLWVCKESILKAMGLGIAEGLSKISFRLPMDLSRSFTATAIDPNLQLQLDDEGDCRMTSWIDPETWRVRMTDSLAGAYAAVATMRQVSRITKLTWDETTTLSS